MVSFPPCAAVMLLTLPAILALSCDGKAPDGSGGPANHAGRGDEDTELAEEREEEEGGGRTSGPVPGANVIIMEREGILVNLTDDAVLQRIPEGYYPMGREKGQKAEGPSHEVFLDEYRIYRTEVTREMFAKFLNVSGREFHEGRGLRRNGDTWVPEEKTGSLPMTGVAWGISAAYARWAGGGLPSEAQWEAAARGTGAGPFPWGEQKPERALCNCREGGSEGVRPVGSYPDGRSPFGCLDMSGNAAEWCRDTFAEDAYNLRGSMAKNPCHDKPSFSRVIRGGGFVSPSKACRVTTRTGLDPGTNLPWIGFRVVIPRKR